MSNPPSISLLERLAARLGPKGFTRDRQAMAPWLVDWRGRYRGDAAALVSPASTEEVVESVRAAAAEGVAIVPQGGNTSMVGGSVPDSSGEALILSLRRMQAVRSIDADERRAVVEAGVVLADLHDRAAEAGLRFPLTLGAKGSATIGGLVSTNAGGTQVLRHGTMRRLVAGVEAVLPDGSLLDGLVPLRKDNRGYDLSQLLIGAEGTLGIVTAASLRLVPAISGRAVGWVGLASAEQALALLRRLETRLGDSIEAFELIPDTALELVCRHIEGARRPIGPGSPWHVLMETVALGGQPDPSAALADALGEIDAAVISANETQSEAFWRLRDSISEAERCDGPAAKHDIAVAVSAMPHFIVEATAAVEARFTGTTVLAFGHLGDGNIHFNVRAPTGSSNAWLDEAGADVSRFVHDLVTKAGGTISAEHGIGQMKRDELVRLGDPARLTAMRAIKQALDPQGIMNPGKLLTLAKRAPRT